MTDLTIDGTMPAPTYGSTPGPEDIGRVITVVRRTIDGPNAGNTEVFCGTLDAFSYCPTEVHETQALPEPIAQLTGMSAEANTQQHLDPEQILFVLSGRTQFVVLMSQHEWSYTVAQR